MKNIALHILDIVENSIRAKASFIRITICESVLQNSYSIIIEDNGSGIPSEIFNRITDPFTTTRITRKVGLGLALLMHHAEICDGRFRIESEQGLGCKVYASFRKDHIDLPPSGDIPGVIRILISGNRSMQIIYSHNTDSGQYLFDTNLVRSEIGEAEFYNPLIQKYMKQMISENLREINAS